MTTLSGPLRIMPGIPATLSWRVLAALALIAAMALAGCGKASYTAAEHLERAASYEKEGDLGAAIIEVKSALQQEPSNAAARFQLGLLHLEIFDGTTAQAELKRAADLGFDRAALRLPLMKAALLLGQSQQVLDESTPLDSFPSDQLADVLALRGQALLINGDLAGARKELEAAFARDRDHDETLYGLAWSELLSGRQSEARAHLARLLELHPRFARGHELLGDVERDAGNLDAAENAYSAAIDVAQQQFSPRIKRAMTRIYRQDFKAATQDLDTLARQYKAHPAINVARGMIAFEERRYADAQRQFEQALVADANHMPSIYYLGASHFGQGNWRQAESYLSRFAARYPNVNEAANLLALARAREGDATRAESTLRAVLARDPNDVAALRMISSIHMSQGRNQEALERLRQVVSLDPDSARTRAQLGVALLSQGSRQEGISELESAIELDPENMASLEVALVVERLRAKEFTAALEAIERIEQRGGEDPLLFNLRGAAHLGLRDTEAARAAFEKAVRLQPGYAPAVRNLAAIAVRQGDMAGGIAILERGLKQNPQATDLLLYLANLQTRNGNVAAAHDTLQRALKSDPQALVPRLALSVHHLNAGKPQDAVRVLEEVQAKFGSEPAWLRQMAQAQGAAGNGQESAALVRKLIESEPNSVELNYALARALALTDDRVGLRKALERVLSLEPSHLEARLALVRLHLSQREHDAAKKLLQPLRAEQPDNAQLAILGGQLAAQEGRFQDAIRDFRQALASEPENATAVSGLYQAQWSAGDRVAALDTARRWADARPDDHAARYNLGLLHLAGGDEESAIRELRTVVERLPNNVAALNNLALLLRDRNPREALGLAERAQRLMPDSVAVLDTLGSVQLSAGDGRAALGTLARALEIEPGHAMARFNYARALVENGRGSEAKPLLETLLSEQPDGVKRTDVEALLKRL